MFCVIIGSICKRNSRRNGLLTGNMIQYTEESDDGVSNIAELVHGKSRLFLTGNTSYTCAWHIIDIY